MIPNTQDKKIQDFMSNNPQCINSEVSIKEASYKMKEANVGFLPICENDKLVGVITDRDIVVKGIGESIDISSPVKDIMTSKVVYCFINDSLNDAARKMEMNYVRRIVVLSEDKKIKGILSLDDIASKVGIDSLTGKILEMVDQKFIKA